MTSTRHGEARSALREVQSRHQDIQKIERTITELADLFREMSVMIEISDPIINQVEEQAIQTTDHLNKGNEQTSQAIVLARKTRRKKWWCFGIIVLIISSLVPRITLTDSYHCGGGHCGQVGDQVVQLISLSFIFQSLLKITTTLTTPRLANRF